MSIQPLHSWLKPASDSFPPVISGPCSAETEVQVMQTALRLAKDKRISALRAGIWKPRTRPGTFEGVGEEGFPWLMEASRATGLPVCVEVGNAQHLEIALKHGVHIVWIGAKTTVNPFSVQEIADALKGVDIPVMIKNPANPDMQLWIGAVERVMAAGIDKLAVIHRGFSTFLNIPYRHDPIWEIPIEFRRLFPDIPMINDPSHIAGKWELLPEIAQYAMDLAMDGLMVESHITPREAWSDARQQLTPEDFSVLLDNLQIHKTAEVSESQCELLLDFHRKQLDAIDIDLLKLFAARMEVVKDIGFVKKENNLPVLQIKRWDKVITQLKALGEELGLDATTVRQLYDTIHRSSIITQTEILRK